MRGVVHVGAHIGEEVPRYVAEGRSPILCFEPQPGPFGTLRQAHGDAALCVPIALGSASGMIDLHVPLYLHAPFADDTQSTSALQMNRSSGYEWGQRHYGHSIVARIQRFDEWALEASVEVGLYGLLVVDVQGMELEVLSGFGEHLASFDNVIVECSEVPIYEGGASAQEVANLLFQRGFRRTSAIALHDDVSFKKIANR